MIRAALFDGPARPFRLEDFPPPKLAPGEALIRVSQATFCSSDLHTIAGKRVEPTPCVLGHEAVGVVEAVAGTVVDADGESVHVGERVIWGVAVGCDECFFCQHDLPQKCVRLRKYGHSTVDPNRGPAGALASHVHLWPGTTLVRVPDAVPDAAAAPASCAIATVAACYAALDVAVETVAVLGCGMLGLTACAWSAAAGVKSVIAVDAKADRLDLARQFGATHTFAMPGDDCRKVVQSLPGRGVDAVLEFTGSPDVTAFGLDLLRTGGTLVLAGAVFPTPPVSLHPETLIRRCQTVRGVHNYHPRDLSAAMRFLAENHSRFPFASLIPRTFPLNEIDAAVRFAGEHFPVRVGIG